MKLQAQPPTALAPLTHEYLPMADDHFIMAHRLSQLCGHAPTLEEDLTIANIALDYMGVARTLYQKIGEDWQKSEDEIAFMRHERAYVNLQLCELPNHDFCHIIVKIWFFSYYMAQVWQNWQAKADENPFIAQLAQKSKTETAYHVRHTEFWLDVFAHSNDVAKMRLQRAFDYLAPYLSEMNQAGLTILMMEKAQNYGLKVAQEYFSKSGGRDGKHTEFMGHILSDLQFLPRQFVGAEW